MKFNIEPIIENNSVKPSTRRHCIRVAVPPKPLRTNPIIPENMNANNKYTKISVTTPVNKKFL